MSITSFYFLCFYAILLLLYYIAPKKCQWMVLLLGSVVYYLLYYLYDGGQPLLILYPIVACFITWGGIRLMTGPFAIEGKETSKKWTLISVVVGNVGILFALKYVNFFINTANGILGIFNGKEATFDAVRFLIPLGISYYSMSLIGYAVDAYYGIANRQDNFFKMALYGMYFPVLISGPILRYREDGEQFFEPHAFDYNQVTRGIQRMLWGFFKKIVIAERMGTIVDAIYGDYTNHPGIYIWIGTVCFAFQLYTDFSGCMDIVLGLSESFGLKLPENFNHPFLSKSVAEYWRKWHITLGVWMKDYVFYPILRSNFFSNLNKKLREKYGKKKGKQLNTFIGMFLLWFTVGVWHGGDWKYVIGSGLLHWCYIVLEELWEPGFKKILERMKIDPNNKWVDVFRVLRTFFLVNIGFVFFRAASVKDACKMLLLGINTFNLNVLWNGGILGLGLDFIEWTIAIVSLVIMAYVGHLQRKNGSVRDLIAAKKLPIRWVIWYALLFYMILLGCYGEGYSAAEFIYQGF